MRALITILLLLTTPLASAEIYKWTDSQGVVHYSDNRPGGGEAAEGKVETVKLSPIEILDNGSVRNLGTENSDLLAQWLGQFEDWRLAALNKLAELTGQAPVATTRRHAVEIYTTSWCGACKQAKQWLHQQGVDYHEYDVQKDASAALRMRSLGGGGGVPFAVIDGQKLQGFSPAEYEAALQ